LIPELPYYLDMVRTIKTRDAFYLCTDPPVFHYETGFPQKGYYKLTIHVYAEDAERIMTEVFIKWEGDWDKLQVFDKSEFDRRTAENPRPDPVVAPPAESPARAHSAR
jgi:hypothetical protein